MIDLYTETNNIEILNIIAKTKNLVGNYFF